MKFDSSLKAVEVEETMESGRSSEHDDVTELGLMLPFVVEGVRKGRPAEWTLQDDIDVSDCCDIEADETALEAESEASERGRASCSGRKVAMRPYG